MADMPSDNELLGRFVDHKDEQAFTTLATRHCVWLLPAAERVLRDPGRAQDVTQAVLIVLARRAPKMRRDLPLSPWLFQTLHYAVKSLRRSEARRERHETAVAVARSEAIDEQAWPGMAEVIDQAVNRLPRRDREAILLRFYQDQSLAQVGASLNTTEEAARKRLARAMERLRSRLAALGVSSAAGLLAPPDALSGHLRTFAEGSGGMGESMLNTLATGALSASTGGAGAAGTPLAIAQGVMNMKLTLVKMAVVAAVSVFAVGGGIALYAMNPRPPANPATRPSVQTAEINTAVPGLAPKISGSVAITAEPEFYAPLAATFNARLSADGRYLLFYTVEGRMGGAVVNPKIILRDLQTNKDTTVPSSTDPGVLTVFTRFNGFTPDNKLMIFNADFGLNPVGETIFDIASGTIRNDLFANNGSEVAMPFRDGLIITGRRDISRAVPPDYKPKSLNISGVVNTTHPIDDILVLLIPPQRGASTAPGSAPATNRSNFAKFLLHDLKTGRQTELPMHPRNSALDDVEAQWTARGRYLYYSDLRDAEGKQIPVCRVWDRIAGKEATAIDHATAVGAGTGPDTMYLAWNPPAAPAAENAKPGGPLVPGPLLIVHDMAKGGPGAPYQLLRGCEIQHGRGDKVAYIEKNATGQRQLKVATIRWE